MKIKNYPVTLTALIFAKQ